jgi:hypothetical protein
MESWMYVTAPDHLWAKVVDNGVDKEVRVIAIGIHPSASMPMDKDADSKTVLLIAEPDDRRDRELRRHWHALTEVRRLFFRPRRRFGR